MIVVGGLRFRLDGDLYPTERIFLDAVSKPAGDAASGEIFSLTLLKDRPRSAAGLYTDAGPPEISWRGETLLLSNSWMFAEIDGETRRGQLYRQRDDSVALYHAMRGAVVCEMPSKNVLPLHSAGVVTPDGTIVFVGRSGAGKTTISSISPFQLLSDELVAVRVDARVTAFASGFWGGMAGHVSPPGEFPVRAIIELEHGGAFHLERLRASAALRLLTTVVAVPPSPRLWRDVLSLATALVERVPTYRMAWALHEPPWQQLLNSIAH